MRTRAAIIGLVLLVTGGAMPVRAVPAAAGEAPRAGQAYALLVGAMPGEALYAQHYRDWLKRLHACLTQSAGVPAANVVVLSGDKEFKDPIVAGLATAESVKKALAEMAGKVKAEDQFVLVLIGHGVATEKPPTLVLPGLDVSAQELADGLAAIAARNQAVVNLSSASGGSVSTFARQGRVVVSATSPNEGGEPIFPEFFLRGLESKRADGEGAPVAGAKDGQVTLLEAYNWATRETAFWIMRLSKTDGGWKLDGKESVEIFVKLYAAPPGAPATQKLAAASDRTKADEPVAIKPPGGTIDQSWVSRRVLSEHAILEDCGEKDGVTAIGAEGYQPLAGHKPGEPGCLARRVVLGRAELLPDPAGEAALKP